MFSVFFLKDQFAFVFQKKTFFMRKIASIFDYSALFGYEAWSTWVFLVDKIVFWIRSFFISNDFKNTQMSFEKSQICQKIKHFAKFVFFSRRSFVFVKSCEIEKLIKKLFHQVKNSCNQISRIQATLHYEEKIPCFHKGTFKNYVIDGGWGSGPNRWRSMTLGDGGERGWEKVMMVDDTWWRGGGS